MPCPSLPDYESCTHWLRSVLPIVQARRFVLLVDELFEHSTQLHCLTHACAHPRDVFAEFLLDPPQEHSPSEAGSVAGAAVDLPATVRPVDESQLSLAVATTGLVHLQLASRRAVSRLVQVCLNPILRVCTSAEVLTAVLYGRCRLFV